MNKDKNHLTICAEQLFFFDIITKKELVTIKLKINDDE